MTATDTAQDTPAAEEQLADLITEHGAQMFEMEPHEGFIFWSAVIHGRITLVFPQGQDPAVRLRHARNEIAQLHRGVRKHFPWCVPGGCQTVTEDDGQPYTMHEGAVNDVPNRGRRTGRVESLLQSRLYHEDALADGPNLVVRFLDEGVPYSGPEADALIADFEAFLAGLKAQRAQLDGAQATFCDTHGWCHEHDDDHGSPTDPDRAHVGEVAVLPVPSHMEPSEDDPTRLLKVQLWATERHYRTPRAYLEFNGDGDEVSMDADQLGEFINQLGTFRDGLAAKHRQLLQAKPGQE